MNLIIDLGAIFVGIAVVFLLGYYTRVFIARNDEHVEALELRDTLHQREARIDQLNRQLNEAYDEYDKTERSRQQLESNHRSTAQHYAQCEADLIVTSGRLGQAADELLTYGVDIRADWTEEQQDDERPDEHVEEFPSLFIQIAKDQKEDHPERAGDTLTWHRPLTPEQEQNLESARIFAQGGPSENLPPVEAWNGFTTSTPVVPDGKPRRTRRTVVPAQRDSSKP